jgi:glycosyltransferase involved in cell wall biosynthesis
MYRGRILAITDAPFAATGYGNQSDKILSELVKRGWEVYIICCNYYPKGNEIKDNDGYVIHKGIKCILNDEIWTDPPKHLCPTKEMVDLWFKKLKPDCVWTLNDYYRVAPYLELGNEFIDKWIHWLPIDNTERDTYWTQFENKMRFFSFLTRFGERMYKEELSNIMFKTMIYHGINPNEFHPKENKMDVKKSHGWGNYFTIVTVAKHQPRKFVYHTAHAVCKFLQKHPDAFWICKAHPQDPSMNEEPEEERDLEKIVNKYGVRKQVEFVPIELSIEQMNDLYNSGDVFISLPGGEGFNIPLAEAMMAGTPCIVTNSTSGPEFLGEGKWGFLVPVEPLKKYVDRFTTAYDIASLTAAEDFLNQAYNDWKNGSKVLKNISEKAKGFALDNFSIDKIVNQWEEAFQRIVRYNNPILWHSHFGKGSGFASDSENLVPALDALGYDIYINDLMGGGSLILDPFFNKLNDKYINNSRHLNFKENIQVFCATSEMYRQLEGKIKVGWSCGEATGLRKFVVDQMNLMTYLATFGGDFVIKAHRDSGVTVPIIPITPCIDQKRYHKLDRKRESESSFVFLHIGIIQERKNLDFMLNGYIDAFPADGKTKFIIKSSDFGDIEGWRGAYKDRPDIQFIYTKEQPLSIEEMRLLYQGADCYVNMSHGEGLGIPDMEAMATGLPIIGSNWDARKQFLNDDVGWMVPVSKMVKAYDKTFPGEDCGEWAEYDLKEYVKTLRYVFQHRTEAREKGNIAAERILKDFSPSKSVKDLDDMFMRLYVTNKIKKPDILRPNKIKRSTSAVKSNDKFLVGIPTKNRLHSLRRTLYSLMQQTVKNFDIIIIDDSRSDELRTDSLMGELMETLSKMGIRTWLVKGNCPNQAAAHNMIMNNAINDYKVKLVFRCDDDVTLNSDALERLFNEFVKDEKCEYAAMGGVIINPFGPAKDQRMPENWRQNIEFAGRLEPCTPYAQMFLYPDDIEYRDDIEHLYSSYMYRPELMKEVGGFPADYSAVAFREETIGIYELYLKGYKLKIVPKSIGFHWLEGEGGCRSVTGESAKKLYMRDEMAFRKKIEELKNKYPIRRQV